MIKKYNLIIFTFIIVLCLVFLVSAVDTSCSCNVLCEGQFKCYSGQCNQDNLTFLNCTNWNSTVGDYVNASECPVCPACHVISSSCVDASGVFNSQSTECEDYFKHLVDFSPYCSQTITGTIFNTQGFLLGGVKISLESSIGNVSYGGFYRNTDIFDYTFGDNYTIKIPRCEYNKKTVVLAASKQGYDSDVKSADIITDVLGPKVNVNFTLNSGLCNVDCTDSFNRCNPDCEGFSITNSTGGVENCSFYSDLTYSKELIQSKCAFKQKNREVFLEQDGDDYVYVNCCEGGIVKTKRPESNFVLTDENKDLVVLEKPTTYKDEPVTLKIIYWDKRSE